MSAADVVEAATQRHFGHSYRAPGTPMDAVTSLAQNEFRSGYRAALAAAPPADEALREGPTNAGELHTTLREVVEIGRRGGYDSDEVAEKLALVVTDYAEQRARVERQRTLADARAVVERETNAYPGASPAITSGIWGGFDQWAVGEYSTLADPDRRLCGQCFDRHTQYEYDDAHRNDEGGY